MNMEDMDLQELAECQERHRQQMAEAREKVRTRKARTHKLVVIGATVAKYYPRLIEMTDDEIRIWASDYCKEN
ncbi:MAG: DUF3847 domain-containing protein [Lachnospiraceae bacterium]|nr:DUF3847 domain-containing protein [Lachnospiraceae bacterium]